jgi:hypothetical protein
VGGFVGRVAGGTVEGLDFDQSDPGGGEIVQYTVKKHRSDPAAASSWGNGHPQDLAPPADFRSITVKPAI